MREILFRGKAVNLHNGSKDFVYGQYVQNRGGKMIYSDTWEDGIQKHYVIEETVGQYTGLTDRNDTKVYEGDILRYFVWGSYECFAVVRIGEYEQDGSGDEYPAIKVCGVYAEVKKYCPLIKEDGDYFPEYLKKSSLLEIGKDVFEVVGNIHDNPELLKGGGE